MFTPGTARLGGLAGRGKTLTEEHRRAISAAVTRRFQDPEQRRMASERKLAYHEGKPRKPKRTIKEEAAYARLKRYGLSEEQYRSLWDAHDGRCAICGKALRQNRGGVSVDHDHDTGVVRGLLCCPCNTSLGWYEKWANAAAGYLRTCPSKCSTT